MTKEQAKEILEHNWSCLVNADYTEEECNEALNMAIEALEKIYDAYKTGYAEAEKKYKGILERQPGEWVYLYEDNYKCSICGSWWCCTDSQIDEMNYCPNCGADMRGEDDE